MKTITPGKAACLLVLALGGVCLGAPAEQILATSGVEGGFVVHVGCGDGKLTAALKKSDAYLVHALDADPAKVQEARKHLLAGGFHGTVSEAQEHFTEPRGEFTLVLEGSQGQAPASDAEVVEALHRLRDHGVKAQEAVRTVSKTLDVPHKAAYRLWLSLD